MKEADADERALLNGLRVLVVEDQFLIAEDLAQLLSDWGCEVLGPTPVVESALQIVESEALDGAILDINLGEDKRSFPVAAALERQEVPFVFLTGYSRDSAFPQKYEAVTRLMKPMRPEVLRQTLVHFAGSQR